MVTMKSDETEFWQTRYLDGKMPWDFHGVPCALTGWLNTATPPGRVLIPGCGSGYEVKAFHDAGWDVVAIDYTPAAVARARAALGALGDKVLLADFFTHDFGRPKFDVVYERTFLCSLPPERWPAYARRMAGLLAERGQLVGFFLYGHEDDPPPYPLTAEAAQALFGEHFVRAADETVTDSLPLFAGRERWQVWQRMFAPFAGGK
jgi:SAM-dependent methyltransferase